MEVLACIPEINVPVVSEPRPPAEVVTPPIATAATAVSAGEDDGDDAEPISPAQRRGAGRRSRSSQFFSPSIIVLAALAAVVWSAAWRNDRLRLEAARLQRPERLAQELPATAGTVRSFKP